MKSVFIMTMLFLTVSRLGGDVQAIAQANEFPARLLGTWSGEGKTMGMDSRPTMTWERTLANKFVHLHFRNEIKTPQGQVQVFEGHAYYKPSGGGKFTATWFDSNGAAHPIQATFTDNALTSDWGTEQTEVGRTTYRLVNDNSIEIVDTVKLKNGTWREFSRTQLKRN